MNIAIYGKKFNPEFLDSAVNLFNKLTEYKADIYIFQPFLEFITGQYNFLPKFSGTFSKKEEITKKTDFIFSIGGDGTFLETVTYVKDKDIPIVGINSGRLGFLANIGTEEINEAIDAIFQNRFTFDYRTLVQLHTKTGLFGHENYALNEVTVMKHDSSSMITIETYLNKELLNKYRADGLIVSTPTGSTAYSLSVGGPLLLPKSTNLIIAPIAPHSLTVRPIVVPDDYEIRLNIESRSEKYMVAVDYRSELVDTKVELLIKRAKFLIKILNFEKNSFFNTLRNKLMWGLDKRN